MSLQHFGNIGLEVKMTRVSMANSSKRQLSFGVLLKKILG